MKIACDVDDVLGAFYPTLCKEFGMPIKRVDIWDGKDTCAWVAAKFPDLYDDLDFWRNIEVLSSPSLIKFEIDHYITSLPPHLHDIREKWLWDNGFPKKPLVCTLKNKAETMKALGIDVLIDDKPSTIQDVRDAGLIGIQFVPYYMTNYTNLCPMTTFRLDEVSDILKRIY